MEWSMYELNEEQNQERDKINSWKKNYRKREKTTTK
jgi:hypothetical protein